jgi:hypothetical protein
MILTLDTLTTCLPLLLCHYYTATQEKMRIMGIGGVVYYFGLKNRSLGITSFFKVSLYTPRKTAFFFQAKMRGFWPATGQL